jgi:hypothetical protein
VDRADPRRFEILWKEVHAPSINEQVRQQAQGDAAKLAPPGMGPAGYPADMPPGAYPYPPGGLPAGHPGSPIPEVAGAPGRPVPGAPGGGLTPEQAAAWQGGGHVHASATVVTATEVILPEGMASPAPAGLFDILLAVTRPDGSTYNVSTRISFRSWERRSQVATVGARLPVLIDESNPSLVAVEVAALPS